MHTKHERAKLFIFYDSRRFLIVMAKEVSNVKPNKATLETIDYKAQMLDFFIKVKHLNGSSLNPKSEFTIKHVIEANIEEVFGKVTKFKTTSIHLHVDTKKKLFHLCS
jgi:hypothetical protein